MAQKIITLLEDDLDGSSATQTIRFVWEGTSLEIDLNDKHAAAFQGAVKKYVEAARRDSTLPKRGRPAKGSVRASGGTRTQLPAGAATIRAWAQANGLTVNDKGAISKHVRELYEAAEQARAIGEAVQAEMAVSA